MSTNTTLRGAIKDIADAIRAKGVSGTMSLNQMPTKIASIPTGGQTKYGVDIDNLIGELDSNGVLQLPSSQQTFSVYSTDIIHADDYTLQNKFMYSQITSFDLPNLTTSDEQALSYMCDNCPQLVSVNMPNLTSFTTTNGGNLMYAFHNCSSLRTVNLKKLSYADSLGWAFDGCSSLELVDFSEATAIPFIGMSTFSNTNETFKVVVPDALYSTWITTQPWDRISSHIIAKSDYYNT